MEAKATHKYIGTSPRKMRLVIDLIRGKSADQAIEILHFQSKHAAKDAAKVLRSAISNILNNEEASRVEPSGLIIKEVYVNCGPTMKRILPAPMGRAYRVKKRSNHLTIIIATKE